MATMPDALGKSHADTLYAAKAPALEAPTVARPTAPTFNLTAKTFTIPTVTGVDYYEWRGIYGFTLVTGTVTRATSDDIAYPGLTRIHARAKTGYVLAGRTIFTATYTP